MNWISREDLGEDFAHLGLLWEYLRSCGRVRGDHLGGYFELAVGCFFFILKLLFSEPGRHLCYSQLTGQVYGFCLPHSKLYGGRGRPPKL